MEYVKKLLAQTDYQKQMAVLEKLEETRIFCRHGLSHSLDVARIGWIIALEGQLTLEKEMVYLAGLLHDLGRVLEYESNAPHHKAGAAAACALLQQIGYPGEKIKEICGAIEGHRGSGDAPCGRRNRNMLQTVIKLADKKSRNCFFCSAKAECKWTEEAKNRTIEI